MSVTLSCSPATLNLNANSSNSAVTLLFTGLGATWSSSNVPSLSVAAGTNANTGSFPGGGTTYTLPTSNVANQQQCFLTFTPPATTGTIVFTDTTSGDGSPTCTVNVVQTLACVPNVCPVAGTAGFTSMAIEFQSTGAGWTTPSFSITSGSGTLSGGAVPNGSTQTYTYTPSSSSPGTVTFTDSVSGLTVNLSLVATNYYTYTLQDMLTASIFWGRWNTKYRFNCESSLFWSFDQPFSACFLMNAGNVPSAWLDVSSNGFMDNLTWITVSGVGNPAATPLFSNATEAKYNLHCKLASSGFVNTGWNTTTLSTVAMAIFSTSATKPNLARYVNSFTQSGYSETLPAWPNPYNSDGSPYLGGNSQVSPPILSGKFSGAYGGYTALVADPSFDSGLPVNVGQAKYTNTGSTVTTAGTYTATRFTGNAKTLYVQMEGGSSVTALANTIVQPFHLETLEGQTWDFIPTQATRSASKQVLQWVALTDALDVAATHEYSLHTGYQGHLDRIVLGGSGASFAMTPVSRRSLSGGALGASLTQQAICWENWGNQAHAYPAKLARNVGGIEILNFGISGNKAADYFARMPGIIYQTPPLANGKIGTGRGGAIVSSVTVSSGQVTGATISATLNGGKGFPPSSTVPLLIFDQIGGGTGAIVTVTTTATGAVTTGTGGVTVVNGGSGYTANTCGIVPGDGNGCLNQGYLDCLTVEASINDTTVAKGSVQAHILATYALFLSTYGTGGLLNIFWYSFGNPWITNAAANALNNDYLQVITALGALNPSWGLSTLAIPGMPASFASTYNASPSGRIFLTDISSLFSQASRSCGNTLGLGNTAPLGYSFGGHTSNYFDSIQAGDVPSVAPGIRPDFLRMLGTLVPQGD
jgi:hypothetical protein